MQKDDVFGNIEWTGENWMASASAPYFRGFGERLDLTEEDREALGPEGKLEVTIETPGETRKRPTEPQRSAWKKILERKDAIWDEVLDALVAEYQLQHPMRAAY